MHYQTLLIDADDTILDFHACEQEAFKITFEKYDLLFNEEVYKVYSKHNHALWKAFEEGKITKPEILQQRFRRTFQELDYKDVPLSFEKDFQYQLSQGGHLIPNAYETLEVLSKYVDIYIVTNGVATTQKPRLSKSGILPFVKGVFISEEIGYQKPHPKYFEYIKQQIHYDPKTTLIVGDSLSSDIQGGINVGVDTCWYNYKGNTTTLNITHEIHEISQLRSIILK